MRALGRTLAIGALAALHTIQPLPVGAQAPLRIGDRVRVTWDEGGASIYGFGMVRIASFDVQSVGPGTIVGRMGERTVVVRTSSIRRLERRVGTKPASAPAMVIGSAGGFVVGFLGGVFKASLDPTVVGGSDVMNSGLVTGVLFGAPLGALTAWIASRGRGIYEPLDVGPVAPTFSLSPGGAPGISLRITTR